MDDHSKQKSYDVINLFFLVVKWWKVVILSLLIATMAGLILAFTVKREYKSVARVLPPAESGSLSALSGLSFLARTLPGGLGRLGKVSDSHDYIAILKSRTVLDEIIHEFNLMTVYGIKNKSLERTRERLISNMEIDWTEENTLEIRVWDADAERAANIANALVHRLNKRSHELQTQEGRNNRIFIEERLRQNREDLHRAEDALRSYQEKSGLILPLDASLSGVSSIGELYVMKVRKEIELNFLNSTVGNNHPQYQQTLQELKSITGRLSNIPEIGIESVRLVREVVIQQKIMELIVPLYEQARINENKDIPVAYVLDSAVPGERPDRPRRLFVLAISIFLGCITAVAIITYREYAETMRLQDPNQWSRVQAFKESLKISRRRSHVSGD